MMVTESFRAMIVEETPDHHFTRRIGEKTFSDLPKGDVIIKVHYSSLNYKDALSATGNKGVTRRFPHTPGIDAAGHVAESAARDFAPGDPVLVTGYDLGMNTSGGFGQYIRVPADWVVPLPPGLSLRESMIYGTAGFTASICLHKLIHAGVTPESGDILVTGASGGVGSLAVALLAHCGFTVLAASGKTGAHGFLSELGAKRIIDRAEVHDSSTRPLLPQRWAGAVDTVGGVTLSTVLRSTNRHGVVTCCGNVASAELNLTVYPFILRGITLIGADSATTPMELRRSIWERLGSEWKVPHLDRLAKEIDLDGLDSAIERILAGKNTGRTIIHLNG
jgi:acrylyl-CoA reductase (NADPH)